MRPLSIWAITRAGSQVGAKVAVVHQAEPKAVLLVRSWVIICLDTVLVMEAGCTSLATATGWLRAGTLAATGTTNSKVTNCSFSSQSAKQRISMLPKAEVLSKSCIKKADKAVHTGLKVSLATTV